MSNRILWLDNDPAQVAPFVNVLKAEGYLVETVTTVTDAEARLGDGSYDLFILDVMIPTKSSTEEERYPPSETDKGHSTGLLFYRRMKSIMETTDTRILVLTQRIDALIKDRFLDAGLPADAFSTKYDLRDVPSFLAKVQGILRVNRTSGEQSTQGT